MKPHIKIAGAFTHYEKIVPMVVQYRSKMSFSVYEGINDCAWNGGRINRGIMDDPVKAKVYRNLDVGISLAFSNPTIDLTDPVGLALLETYHDTNNSIITQNLELVQLIRKKYPKYEIIFSITGHPSGVIKDPGTYYRELEKNYDVIVPKLEHNMEIEKYTDNPHKYELLINDDCFYNCPLWKEHFDAIAEQNTLGNPYNEKTAEIEECWLPKFDPDIGDCRAKAKLGFSFGMSLSKDQIQNRLDAGIHRFKVSGREMEGPMFQSNLESICTML